jgi:hypothetical protein
MAGGLEPITALAVIAEILGLPDGDTTAIVAKVRELVGGAPAADPEGESPMMSHATNTGGESATVLKLQAEQGDLLKRLATIEGERARDAAAATVDSHIKAGRFVPAQRETLVKLALSSPSDFEAFAGAAPVVMSLGERGTSAGAADAAAFEPSADVLAVAGKMGIADAATMFRSVNKAAV